MWQNLIPKAAILATCGVVAGGLTASTASPLKIPDSKTGKITACVAKKGGAVRFINAQKGTKCKSSEKKVVFDQKGPAGAQGERGPSDAYVAHRADIKTLNQMQVGPNTVVSLSLPAGSFVVTANTSVKSTTPNTTITCALIAGTGVLTATAAATSVSEQVQAATVTGTYTNNADGVVGFLCQPSGPVFPAIGFGEAQGATIVATQVGKVTGP